MDAAEERKLVSLQILVFTALIFILLIFFSQARCFATTVFLQWDDIKDSNVAGYKVYYQADSSSQPFSGTGAGEGAAPIDVHSQTSATISGLDPTHSYYFAVTAYDSAGVESLYSNVTAVAELSSPAVSLDSPVDNSTVSGIVSVTASASDNVGVTGVEFYVDDVLKSTDTSAPYVYLMDTSSLVDGSYVLLAKAYDAAGNIGQSSRINLNVVRDAVAPTASITAPAINSTVGGTVTVTASASDNVGVSKVEFYENGTLLSATNVIPYSHDWNTTLVPDGVHTLIARVFDAAGNSGQTAAVSVNVKNGTNSVYQVLADGVTPTYYHSIQEAYNASPDGTLVKLWSRSYGESLLCDRPVAITFKGGYESSYSNISGETVLDGSLIVKSGSVILDGLTVR